MHIGYNPRKMKLTSYVEWFVKLDVPESDWGYYAVLDLNGCEIYRWKLTKLDMMQVFNEGILPGVSEEEMRNIRTVDENGLDMFIAGKISDVIGAVIAFQTQGARITYG